MAHVRKGKTYSIGDQVSNCQGKWQDDLDKMNSDNDMDTEDEEEEEEEEEEDE